MPIEYRQSPNASANRAKRTVMTACPFCGESLRENQSFVHHRPHCEALSDDGEVVK